MSKFWTPARITELRTLWDAGDSYEQIAAHMGITVAAAEGARYSFDLPPRKQGRKFGVPNKATVAARQPVAIVQAKPVMESGIPWPSPRQCMGRR